MNKSLIRISNGLIKSFSLIETSINNGVFSK